MDFDVDYVTTQTDDIVVSACQAFLEDEDDSNACSYYLRIENNSSDKIQILGKNFNITDDRGNCYCDNAAGFKGEIPELEPGEYFEFADTKPLHSAYAVLYGSCRIIRENLNQIKDIKIPAVPLIGNVEYACTMN